VRDADMETVRVREVAYIERGAGEAEQPPTAGDGGAVEHVRDADALQQLPVHRHLRECMCVRACVKPRPCISSRFITTCAWGRTRAPVHGDDPVSSDQGYRLHERPSSPGTAPPSDGTRRVGRRTLMPLTYARAREREGGRGSEGKREEEREREREILYKHRKREGGRERERDGSP
jgi:hypothetical protein